MDRNSLVFNICAFIASLFLLQTGAVLFTVNTAILARRCGIPETLVALLTAGAEWEELAVVVASIIQLRPSLGLGNVVGSTISNVMGAFALGLLFNKDPIQFDLSAKIYSGALFVVSTIFTLLAFTGLLDLAGGIFFIVAFAVYVVSICSAIYDGILAPTPEEPSVEVIEELPLPAPSTDHQDLHISIYPSVLQCHPTESSPLLPTHCLPPTPGELPEPTKTGYHVFLVLLGLASLFTAAYTLSQAAASLASLFKISNTLIGVTVVSISTTLPEKIIAIIDSWQGHTTIMTATTAGSNMFLLTLCVGIIFATGSEGDADTDPGSPPTPGTGLLTDNLVAFEVWTVWACSVLLLLVTWTGARRWLGALLFGLYISFVVVELTFFKR
ncbi:Sodium/calcium exchanger protein-domain-containing protein [Rhexocercosporidium sp. MPI-PUGE-AT-0058]|nr:Sodium/calcium exchanger protein-domain-containing protein [Rhexocercosporidium sp. MPI-PUGE-AT-0058]